MQPKINKYILLKSKSLKSPAGPHIWFGTPASLWLHDSHLSPAPGFLFYSEHPRDTLAFVVQLLGCSGLREMLANFTPMSLCRSLLSMTLTKPTSFNLQTAPPPPTSSSSLVAVLFPYFSSKYVITFCHTNFGSYSHATFTVEAPSLVLRMSVPGGRDLCYVGWCTPHA